MKPEDIKLLVESTAREQNKLLLDEFHKLAIGLRESVTPSFSAMMKDFTDRLEVMEQKLDKQIEQTQPAVDIIGASKVFGKLFVWFAGFALAIGTSIVALKQFFKSLIS